MRRHERGPFEAALQRAKAAAYGTGEFVGQESFMRASEVRALAARAGIGRDTRVLDLCCGVAGPGRLLTAELGCSYLGVDESPSAVEEARARADGLPCEFEVARVPPLPDGPFEVVLLLETMLAFREKDPLVAEVARVLPDGGRFAFTVEEGAPLADEERAVMPDADTVWLVTLADLEGMLSAHGFQVRWREDWSAAHAETSDALASAYLADGRAIAAAIGTRTFAEIVAAHRLWSSWLREGRVRKYAIVAERRRDKTPVSRRQNPGFVTRPA